MLDQRGAVGGAGIEVDEKLFSGDLEVDESLFDVDELGLEEECGDDEMRLEDVESDGDEDQAE